MQGCVLRTSQRGPWSAKLSAKDFMGPRLWRTLMMWFAHVQIAKGMPHTTNSHPTRCHYCLRYGPSRDGALILLDHCLQLQETTSTPYGGRVLLQMGRGQSTQGHHSRSPAKILLAGPVLFSSLGKLSSVHSGGEGVRFLTRRNPM